MSEVTELHAKQAVGIAAKRDAMIAFGDSLITAEALIVRTPDGEVELPLFEGCKESKGLILHLLQWTGGANVRAKSAMGDLGITAQR